MSPYHGKDTSYIPDGRYCQTVVSRERNDKQGDIVCVRLCPFFSFRPVDSGIDWVEAYCNYVEDYDWRLDDKIKICGVKINEIDSE